MVVGHRCLFVVLRFRRGTSFWHNCSDRVKLRFKTIHFSAIVNWTNCKLSMLVPVSDDACDVDQEVDLHRERIAEGCAGRAQRCASFCEVWQFSQGDLDQPWRDLRGERSLCHWHRCGRAGPKSSRDQVGSSRQKRENCVVHFELFGFFGAKVTPVAHVSSVMDSVGWSDRWSGQLGWTVWLSFVEVPIQNQIPMQFLRIWPSLGRGKGWCGFRSSRSCHQQAQGAGAASNVLKNGDFQIEISSYRPQQPFRGTRSRFSKWRRKPVLDVLSKISKDPFQSSQAVFSDVSRQGSKPPIDKKTQKADIIR